MVVQKQVSKTQGYRYESDKSESVNFPEMKSHGAVVYLCWAAVNLKKNPHIRSRQNEIYLQDIFGCVERRKCPAVCKWSCET